jgi:hypothetical protein
MAGGLDNGLTTPYHKNFERLLFWSTLQFQRLPSYDLKLSSRHIRGNDISRATKEIRNDATTLQKCFEIQDRHGQAHRVFFTYAKVYKTPKKKSTLQMLHRTLEQLVASSCEHGNEPSGFIKHKKSLIS